MTRLLPLIIVLSVCPMSLPLYAADKPNIVLLYIDDWAWNGTPVAMDDNMKNSAMPVLKMPNVERLAKNGMKFSCAYGSPQCSPARACILTGQSSPRNGFTVFMNNKGQEYFDAKSYPGFPVIPCVSNSQIKKDALTIPKALKPLGYVSAHFGKWHLRSDPGEAGFAAHDGPTDNKEGNTLGEGAVQRLPADLTDPKKMFSVTERALAFMEQQVKAGKPFYLQISHYAMHEGRECLPATREKYAKDPLVQAYYQKIGKNAETVNRKQDPAVWLGMGEDLDGRIGAVLDKLEKLGIAENTYVILASDNGYRHSFLPGLTQPLHGGKWWLWARADDCRRAGDQAWLGVRRECRQLRPPADVSGVGGRRPEATQRPRRRQSRRVYGRQKTDRRVPDPQPVLPLPALPHQHAALGGDQRSAKSDAFL